MSAPLIIVGSGFAAYQLVKTLRRKNSNLPIQLFTADNGDEYNKPDLSHVFTRKQTAADLITSSAAIFAEQHQVELFTNTRVENIDTQEKTISANGTSYQYSKLVLATGAKTFVPKMDGDAAGQIITLNSLEEYQASQQKIANSKRILIMGGGLIGTELAMDLASSGKQITMVEPGAHLMTNILPEFVSTELEKQLRSDGVRVECLDYVVSVQHQSDVLIATTNKGFCYSIDSVISAAGLVPNTDLARVAGADVNRGIVVDNQLKTSIDDVYAIGDCAEINGKVMAFLQPIILSANALAAELMGENAELKLPPMMVKVKTPGYPIQLGGNHNHESNWNIEITDKGITAKASNSEHKTTGFIVTKDNLSQAFPLFREVQTS
ncbi:NADH:flavorubredoxin reductase NorW [Vibrio sp. HN007]|uniref:NADH:flavorubredoxin reductase NorW n=1 Tax=Vibrio iocasae TaxID=3098914 RepID=UPI0035D424FD